MHRRVLGKSPATKSDEFSEKFQTAFDPPSFSEDYIEEKAKAFGLLFSHYCQFLALQLSSGENTIGKFGNGKQQLVHMVSVLKRNIAQKKGNWYLHSIRVVDGRGVKDEAGPVPTAGEHLQPLVQGGPLRFEEDVPLLEQAKSALLV